MTTEQFFKACLNAPPGIRAKMEMLLNGDQTVAAQPIADARSCTQSEAARRLGVSRPTIISWMRAGRIQTINVGGIPRVLLASIDAIARGQTNAADDASTADWIAARAARLAAAGRKGAAARNGSKGAAHD